MNREKPNLLPLSDGSIMVKHLPNGVEDGKETRLEGVFEHDALLS